MEPCLLLYGVDIGGPLFFRINEKEKERDRERDIVERERERERKSEGVRER